MAKRLGELLVEKKLVSLEDLQRALVVQKKTHEILGATLIKMGCVTEEGVLAALSEQLHTPLINLREAEIDEAAIRAVPVRLVQHYQVMPVRIEGDALLVAIAAGRGLLSLEDLAVHLGREVKGMLAAEGQIAEAIKKYYGIGAGTVEQLLARQSGDQRGPVVALEEVPEDIDQRGEDASVIQLVNQIFEQAVHERATDIHIEPGRDELLLRYRVDGVLYDTKVPQDMKHFYAAIISRIKIMARMDIAEKRLPQDGRIKIRLGQAEYDLRISILPSVHGEHVVIRILPTKMLFSLERLGLLPEDRERLERVIHQPHGMIIVSGPTGSGKTTTLYTGLGELNTREKKIITVEDPVEYWLRGITQIQVHHKIQLTFANTLRSILRHDPDIIMVGEIRDRETAEIAIQAALTGHLVFSTLHTNDAASVVARLMHMGIQPYLIAASARAFLAQRLTRLNCPACAKPVPETRVPGLTTSYRGEGCEACRFTGYQGRTAIYEILIVNDTIREMIFQGASAEAIKKTAMESGMTSLYQCGLKKVAAGLTTVEQVMLVTQSDA